MHISFLGREHISRAEARRLFCNVDFWRTVRFCGNLTTIWVNAKHKRV